MAGNVRVLKIPSGWNEVKSEQQWKTAYFCKVNRTSLLNHKMACTDVLTSNYYTSKEISILCSISVNPEQNVLVNS